MVLNCKSGRYSRLIPPGRHCALMTLQGDNTNTFRYAAHKFLLSCVSPVFKQMLDDANNWEESKETTIVLTVSTC